MDKVTCIFGSHYSFSGSSILTVDEAEEINESKPVSVFSIAKHYELKDVFLADKTLSGLIDSYNAAGKIGINLHFGFKVICCEDINDKSEKSFETEHKIIVWLNDSRGYVNFVKLVSKAQIDGFYYIPRVDKNLLKEFWSEHLSISIPFYDSFIHKNTLEFGKCVPEFPAAPTLFIENNGLPFDDLLKERVLEYGKSENLEIVNSKSIYYYKNEDYKAYLVNKAINKRTTLEKPNLEHNSSDQFSFESAQEIGIDYENKSKFSQSFSKYNLPFYGIRLPSVDITSEIRTKIGAKIDDDNYTILKALCVTGFKRRIADGTIQDSETQWYKDRIKHELKTLKTLGFVDYILIVWDMVNFCHDNKIPVGRGRGSAAGSAVLYLLNITDIPVKRHGLWFERFLSADRAAVIIKDGISFLQDSPDVDQDVSRSQRYKVVDYLNKKYPGQTSKILNISTLQGKVLIKEVAKCVDNCEQTELNLITDLIPVEFGNVADIERTYNENPDFKTWCDNHSESYKIALKLRGLAKNVSVHASGYLITHCQINEFIPTQLTADKEIVSSFDMYSAGNIAVKIDLLGLKTLDILDTAGKLCDKPFDKINIDDPSIYKYLSNPEAPFMGIFQAEEGLGEKTLRKISPEKIDHIIDSIAIGRPGAMRYTQDYCDFKTKVKFPNIDPRVEDILGPTGGLLIYQEQLMALSVRMAKFTPIESGGIRKAVGKKIKAKMLSYKERFIKQSIENDYSEEYSEDIWKTFENSADYSFNLSHSASYGYLTAITAYFKANHPKEFFLALLKNAQNESEPLTEVNKIQKELKYFGIQLLPPCLLKGNIDFVIEGNDIRFGLNSIKGLGEAVIEKLNNFRPENCNKFQMFQAARQAGLSCGAMAALVMSGALDIFVKESRSKLSFECLLFSKLKDKEKLFCIDNAPQYNDDLITMCQDILNWHDSRGKKVARSTRLNTLRKETKKYQEIYRNNKANQALSNYWYEKELLGFGYSSNLKTIFSESGSRTDLINLEEYQNLDPNKTGIVVCIVDDVKTSISKKGNAVMKLFVSDETKCNYFYFAGKSYQEYLSENKTPPKEKDIIAIKLMKSKDGTSGFVQKLSIQSVKIFTKMSEIKDAPLENTEENEIIVQKIAENPQTEMIYS